MIEESVIIQMCRLAIESVNYSETASILKQRYNLPQNLTSIRKWVSITNSIAKRDNIDPADLLELVSQVRNKHGDVTSEKYAIRPDEPNLAGLKLKAVSKSHHTVWEKYALDEHFDISFLTDEYLQSLAASLDTITPLDLPTLSHNQKTLLIVLSDRHIGASVENHSIYKNEYNAEVYKERLQEVLKRLLWYKTHFNSFEKLVILDLGDVLDGYEGHTTRGGHRLQQNLTSREQFDTFVNNEIPFIDAIVNMNIAASYEYHATSNSNHDGAFAYTAYRTVQEVLKSRYPQIVCKVYKTFFNHLKVYNTNIVFTHGKDEKYRKYGLPYVLNDKTEIFIKEWLNDNHITKNVRFIKGDLHQYGLTQGKFFDYVNVGSLFGSSGYIHHNYGKGKASCLFSIIERNTYFDDFYCLNR